MYILETIGAVDMITVCFITAACVITMICIIIVSSRSSKKKNITFTVEEKKAPIKEPVVELKKEATPIVEKKEQTKADIQSVLDKMESELETGPKEAPHTFEEEQEEKAIISYRELLKVAGKLKEEIRENEEKIEQMEATLHIESPKEEIASESTLEKKFRSTEFISPVYGKQRVEAESYVGKHEENEEEMFLNKLKDLRKNLE